MPRTTSKKNAKAVETAKAKTSGVVKPEVVLQVDDTEVAVNIEELSKAAKKEFKTEKGHRTKIESVRIYLKPQEGAAYYVVNDDFTGKLEL